MYEMHNNVELYQLHSCVIRHDVMQARVGLQVTGFGIFCKIDSDIVDFVIKGGTDVI